MTDLVLIDDTAGVRTISLNRPERHNALNDPLIDAYRAALDDAVADVDVRCIVLRGEGRSFCSGRDTAALGQHGNGEPVIDWLTAAQTSILKLLESPKPVIAAVKGYAIGGGFEMALAADIRIASPDARLATPEVTLGSVPDNGGTQVLTTLVGPARAKEMILSGRKVDATEALSWGLLNRVVPLEDLDAEVAALAAEIASRSPLVNRLAKQLVDSCWAETIRSGMRQETVAQTLVFASADYAEARAARSENRPPVFTGN